ncbi:1,2-phenylacetyl-CoA epoxidase subunit PaaC [Paludifilum halophilum]|uniref:Phenylacetate-CoA oxygenase subunit PaaI n=1 Tax=Paludifilum halophilum TaxID=1642702 RepID=A0A235B4A8_9BACL|nr:1,2-phenylacetyl-CoA epoxidase subunit PaaC [Paludifilum halophilum]OYD07071.1 phenylacetate-CoA oxygenase subunit PaaI [Paludifilum halophilum]
MRVENAEQAAAHPAYRKALADLLLQLADDELCLGHRDSEWLGLAPDIEEDVSFSSIAQDEVGHAVFFLERLQELGERDPDLLAFQRPPDERRNAVLTERPNGDWAATIARHFLYDCFDAVRLEALLDSGYRPLARGVAKIRREEHYHGMHLSLWFTRLGAAGGEARQRITAGVESLWPDVAGLFSLGAYEAELIRYGVIACDSAEMHRRWEERVRPAFEEAGLVWPGELPLPERDGRRGEHTLDLQELIETMGQVHHLDPAAQW